MQLNTECLILKRVEIPDLDTLIIIYGVQATNTFNPLGAFPDIGYAKDVLQEWLNHWEDEDFGYWAVST